MDDGGPRDEFIQPSRLRTLIGLEQAQGELVLRGAVVQSWVSRGRQRVVLRDLDYRTSHATVVDVPVPSERCQRGEVIEVYGRIDEEKGPRNTSQKVLFGTARRVAGKAEGLLRREQHARRVRERDGGRQAMPTTHCDTLYLVTGESSHARGDVAEALISLPAARRRLPDPEFRKCNLHNAKSIAWKLRCLLHQVKSTDVVLVARGGGDREWLDHFEDEAVVDALASLAERCPTYTAIGHAEDMLLLDGIVHGMFATPSAAISGLQQRLQDLCEQLGQRPAERSVPQEHASAHHPRSAHPPADATRAASPRSEPEQRAKAPYAEVPFIWPPRHAPSWSAYSPPAPASGRPGAESARRKSQGEATPRGAASAPLSTSRSGSKRLSGGARATLGVISLISMITLGLWFVAPAHPLITSITSIQPASAPEPLNVVQPHPDQIHSEKEAPRDPTVSPKARAAVRSAPSNAAPRANSKMLAASLPAKAVLAEPHPEPAAAAGPPEALRILASLIAPFEFGRDLGAARGSCAERYGMWIGGNAARCRLPGGREYQFGLAGGLVETITLRQLGNSPLPLLSASEEASLQTLARGPGPWTVAFTRMQLSVRPRAHHPGL